MCDVFHITLMEEGVLMLRFLGNAFAKFARRYLPDALIFAIILTSYKAPQASLPLGGVRRLHELELCVTIV